MTNQAIKRSLRRAIYTRVSTDQGLEQDFNSLDAQREASEAYIKSQAHEGCCHRRRSGCSSPTAPPKSSRAQPTLKDKPPLWTIDECRSQT